MSVDVKAFCVYFSDYLPLFSLQNSTMVQSQHIAHALNIDKLKGISNLDEIRFDEKPLTAILGPNGCGKSTILHALACCYQPLETSPQENWRFRDFFTPTTDSTWVGSSLCLIHSYREGNEEFLNQKTTYAKATGRWVPRYETRPRRFVAFIGIKSCVPKIEEETYTSLIRYATVPLEDGETIKEKMSLVFNRQYEELNTHNSRSGRRYSGLALNGTRYSSLAMGAGEQRVLEILSVVFNAPKNALILIDEIDLLLHTDALKKLLKVLYSRASLKNLQIIFTTHREAVLDLTNEISIKHIHTAAGKTSCFSNTKPDAIQRLTGSPHRVLEVFVEDDMAQAIVEFELQAMGLKRFTTVTKYGAATNCFTLAAGLILGGNADFKHQLFLLDGDLYKSESERTERIGKALSGTEINATDKRQQILSAIKMFRAFPDCNETPEAQLHKMIKDLGTPPTDDINEIWEIASSINVVSDNHSFLGKIIETLDLEKNKGLSEVVRAAAISPRWGSYVQELREWLSPLQSEVREEAV